MPEIVGCLLDDGDGTGHRHAAEDPCAQMILSASLLLPELFHACGAPGDNYDGGLCMPGAQGGRRFDDLINPC